MSDNVCTYYQLSITCDQCIILTWLLFYSNNRIEDTEIHNKDNNNIEEEITILMFLNRKDLKEKQF